MVPPCLSPLYLSTCPPQSRVLHGVRPEILALSEIPFVKAFTARALYRAGLRCAGAAAPLVEQREMSRAACCTVRAANLPTQFVL